MKKIIKSGTVVSDTECIKADVLIEDELIKAVEPGINADDAEVIDANGKYILPGAIDVHTHMDLDVGFDRACDDFYNGTVAAACGGTTTIIDHMAFGPKGCYPWHQVEEYHKLADGNAVIDYGFHGVLQEKADERTLSEIKEISEKEGITSFKLYLTYDSMLHDKDVFAVLNEAKKDDVLITVHCENDGMINFLREKFGNEGKLTPKYHPLSRPAEAEAEAINRLLYLAECADEAPVYVVHLSSKAGLDEIITAKKRGRKHFGVETCPQYLLLEDDLYEDPREGLKAIMSPPLRKESDRNALWDALSNDILDTVATDHCPFTFEKQKQRGASDFRMCPNGAPGVEERLILLFSEGYGKGRLTLPQVVKYACTNPAKVFGLYPKKGVIKPSADADILIIDPDKKHTLTHADMHGNSDYTCYEGFEIKGMIETVMQRGRIIVKDNKFLGSKGDGHYLKREKSSVCRPES
ncbi:MAG: dihydropyrimidinase [Lachnospiraceae bacterium]|nr:dihydropyrimidinase [Lachnospiraceae bacterium]